MKILKQETININDKCYLCKTRPAIVLLSVSINDVTINLALCNKCQVHADLERWIIDNHLSGANDRRKSERDILKSFVSRNSMQQAGPVRSS